MKICIKEVISDDIRNVVKFSTEFGNATALWEGDKPVTGCNYHVEVDINDTLVWGNDIIENAYNSIFTIREEDNYVFITGDLESVDADGYSILRFGENIIPFMTTGKHFQVGTSIEIATKAIALSPVAY